MHFLNKTESSFVSVFAQVSAQRHPKVKVQIAPPVVHTEPVSGLLKLRTTEEQV